MKLLLGQSIAKKKYQEIMREKKKIKIQPGLTVVMVGKNKASQIYVKLKEQAAKKLNFYFKKILLPTKTSEKKLISLIKNLNQEKKIHGIIVQLPLPKHLNKSKITQTILPEKDIDGFHPKTKFLSPTHQAILKLLSFYKIKIKNKKVVILANSLIFAEPLTKRLKNKGAKVKIILKNNYSLYSPEDKECLKRADVLIIAIGKPKFLKGRMIKKNAVIIDVGYSRSKGKTVGDVDFESCAKKALAISPVPGGVGPLTVVYLMKNTLLAAKNLKIRN